MPRSPSGCPAASAGETLKEAGLEAQGQVEHECDLENVVKTLLALNEGDASKVGTDDVDKAVADRVFDVDDCTAEPFERMQDTDAKGKKITNARYQKRFYGATVEWTLTCGACQETLQVSTEVDEQASAFEEVA